MIIVETPAICLIEYGVQVVSISRIYCLATSFYTMFGRFCDETSQESWESTTVRLLIRADLEQLGDAFFTRLILRKRGKPWY